MMFRADWLLRLKARIAGLDPNDVVLTTVGPIIIRGKIDPEPEALQHELIHVMQFQELLGIGFVILFWIFFLWGLFRHGSAELAYLRNPFEVEANRYMDTSGYLENRPRFAWARLDRV